MKGVAKKKSGEGRGIWKGMDPQSFDYEDLSLVLHHQEQLGYEGQRDHPEEDRKEQELEECDKEEEGEGEEEIKLDEGFYEIEAVRQKRSRKGQLQYLIKWRGWPETANTWEPRENLQSCYDVIDDFEERLRSGKNSRKRKRKPSASILQPKKMQMPQHFDIVACNGTGVESEETPPSASFNNYALVDPSVTPQSVSSSQAGLMDGDVVTIETTKQHNVIGGFANVGKKVCGSREGSEYDPKLSELKGALTTNEVPEDKRAMQVHETKTSEGSFPSNTVTKVDCVELAQNNRPTGAKRRKPSYVKRFKQDIDSHATNIAVDSVGSLEQPWSEKRTTAVDCYSYKNTSHVIQIIQPISYSASIANNVQDVSVIFKALRSDGKEVIVDNKFLKDTNPLLLIDFYEQHIKYNPVP